MKFVSLKLPARTLWFTGLSGAGKSTLTQALSVQVLQNGRLCCVLDGDALRQNLCSDLGFSPADRRENIRRTAEVARLMNAAGVTVLAALISPLRADRAMAKSIIGPDQFREVYVSTSLSTCEQRDPKGLYLRARSGDLPGFTGVDAPYEPPTAATLEIDTEQFEIEKAVARLMRLLD